MPQQQNGGVRGGHALHLVRGVLHALVVADDSRKAVSLRIFFAQQQILAQKFLLLRRALDQQIQMFQVYGLLDEIVSAFLHRCHGLFHRAVGGDQDDGNRGIGLLGFAENFESRAAGKF